MSLALAEAPAPFFDAASRAERGRVFALGRHTLMCGDATSSDDVKRLLGDVLVDQVVTDPPYGADLLEKWASCKRMFSDHKDYNARRDDCANDSTLLRKEVDDYRVFYAAALRRVPFAPVNTCYIFMSSANLHHLRAAADDAGIHHSDYLVWLKDRFVIGRRDYHSRYESIFYGWHGKHAFYGAAHQRNVLEFPRNRKNRWHPCEKPRPLVERLILNGTPPASSEPGRGAGYLRRHAVELGRPAVVCDPFAGGGTTILAAEATGRTCYAMELDPSRCDLIRERWERRAEEGIVT